MLVKSQTKRLELFDSLCWCRLNGFVFSRSACLFFLKFSLFFNLLLPLMENPAAYDVKATRRHNVRALRSDFVALCLESPLKTKKKKFINLLHFCCMTILDLSPKHESEWFVRKHNKKKYLKTFRGIYFSLLQFSKHLKKIDKNSPETKCLIQNNWQATLHTLGSGLVSPPGALKP